MKGIIVLLTLCCGCATQQIKKGECPDVHQFATPAVLAKPEEALELERLRDLTSARFYRVAEGDLLSITIYKNIPYYGESKTIQAKVRDNGAVFLMPLGEVLVAGKTAAEIEGELINRLSQYIINPYCQVEVVEYKNKKVFVYGEIGQTAVGAKEGAPQGRVVAMNQPMRILDVISQVGGIGTHGDWQNIKVIRSNGEVALVNLDDILFRNNVGRNLEMQNNDIIYIPRNHFSRVMVLGEVAQPGGVVADSNLNLLDAIFRAGGPTEKAYLGSVNIVRTQGTAKPVISTVNLKSIIKYGKMDGNVKLQHGDIVYVPQSKLRTFTLYMQPIAQVLGLIPPWYIYREVFP